MLQSFSNYTLVGAGLLIISLFCTAFFICYHRIMRKCKCQRQYTDKEVVLIIGSAPGIALETALEVVRRGARVVLANKIFREAEEMRATIQYRLGVPYNTILIHELDLASFSSITMFIAFLVEVLPSFELVAIVNTEELRNAPPEMTVDGYDKTFQINYAGPFLLIESLDALLEENQFPRMVTLSAGQSSPCKLEDIFEVTQAPHNIQSYGNNAYQISKACTALISLLYWTNASCVDPGYFNLEYFYGPWKCVQKPLCGIEGVLHALFKPSVESCYEDMKIMFGNISPLCTDVIEQADEAIGKQGNNRNIIINVTNDLYDMLMDHIVTTTGYVEYMLECRYVNPFIVPFMSQL